MKSIHQASLAPSAPKHGMKSIVFSQPKRLFLLLVAVVVATLFLVYRLPSFQEGSSLLSGLSAWLGDALLSRPQTPILRRYNLNLGVEWLNPDGGRWRVMLGCNGQTPCETLKAEEGDLVEITVHNDLYYQSSIHWSGRTYQHTGPWNDGTPGISQFPMLSRGNWTSTYDTQGSWGLSWFAEHATAGSIDGLYGSVWVAPSPARPRPYHLITKDPRELRLIKEAEDEIQHMVIMNHMHRDTTWKLLRMKAEGSEFYCHDSLLVNGKGRVHCRQEGYEQLNGRDLDETGCARPAGQEEKCTPSEADYEVIETKGQAYVMLNVLNSGFEHSVRVSIDGHKMIVVANDGGFVEPQETDVVYVSSAARVTVLVKADRPPKDYAIRILSTSHLQNLQGYSILRYPARRQPNLRDPMHLPAPSSPSEICLLPDSTLPTDHHCTLTSPNFVPPYPPEAVLPHTAAADFTFHLTAAQQPSQTEPHAPEYMLNRKPWQLFRASLNPILFDLAAHNYDDPIIPGPLPVGSVVDVVIRNTLNETVPLYKHGVPFWLLGSSSSTGQGEEIPFDSVEQGAAMGLLNLQNPGRAIVHDLPPLGWSVIRFRVVSKEVTMLHAVKIRLFALGMSVPIIEGFTPEDSVSIPDYARNRPHVEFEPKNDGVFG